MSIYKKFFNVYLIFMYIFVRLINLQIIYIFKVAIIPVNFALAVLVHSTLLNENTNINTAIFIDRRYWSIPLCSGLKCCAALHKRL
uniref:Hypothetical secreted protein n=1 Tax=Glossina morsitans morsitans TaxID=37546 RepID=D3TSH7_GLOMM